MRASRAEIVGLLERWDELQALGLTANGGGEASGKVLLQAHERGCGVFSSLRCTCWIAGVAELEECLRRLRALRDGRYRHLVGRYGETTRVRRRFVRYRASRWEGLGANEDVLIPRFEAGQRGARERVYDDVLVVRWPSWVDGGMVDDALDWLAACELRPLMLPSKAAAA